MRPLATLLYVCASLALGCETSAAPVLDRRAVEPATAALDSVTEGSAPVPAAPSVVVRGAHTLDRRADGAVIVGRVEPVPPDSDADRVLVIRVLHEDRSIAPELDGARVLDARFAGDAVVTIGEDHTLRAHTAASAVELDRDVRGPLSVVGTQVAYTRGQMPFFELARADVQSGEAETLTHGMAPVWSPALTADGRAIVFVSGVEGSPRFYRIEGRDTPRALPSTSRTPSSPIAPYFEDALLVFEDEHGKAWVDLDRGELVRTTAGGAR